jgi:diacylglycerol O-acyltransferase / wax synthase
MASSTRQAMPAADAAWLHMDRATNPMVVNSLVMLEGRPEQEVVVELLERRLVERFPRFRQRVVDALGRRPAFEDDPNFELEGHLHRLVLPEPGDSAALEALVGDLITAPLDPNRPLWHAYLIEGWEGRSAMLWRIHHCIADGIALSRVLLSITDDADAAIGVPAPDDDNRGLLGRLAAVPGEAISAARKVGGGAAHEGMETLAHPEHLRELAGGAMRDVTTTAKLLGASPDAPSELRRPLAGTRKVAWSAPVPLAEVKDAAHRRRVTINDLLVTALAAALHDHLAAGSDPPREIHTMVPFNLRSLDDPVPAELGNDFALILLELPVGPLAPAERLREVSSRMDAIKSSHEAPIAYGLVGAIGLTPPWLEDRLIGFFTDKASLVVTNVPGPQERLRFAGVPVSGVLVWAPCSGSLGMTVSIFSYAGEVTVGFMVDSALVANPQPLARAYERELRVLCG